MLELLSRYDALLLDLDGTVFAGDRAIPGAAEGIAGRRRVFVTNNASRSPQQVADHLGRFGVVAKAGEVLTSAQAACALAVDTLASVGEANRDEPGTAGQYKALVVGSESFRQLAREAGFTVVDSADARPDVVLQGHSPNTGWAQLSEAALAIRSGATYIASNLDTTLPSERGFLVGNGSMVAAVVSATGVRPTSAGKPEPAMFHVAAKQAGASSPLVVGDRLDTDIAGGRAAGMDTLMVLTGVSTHWEVIDTPHRPTHIRPNLSEELTGWTADIAGEHTVRVTSGETAPGGEHVAGQGYGTPSELAAGAALAAAAPVAWQLLDSGIPRDQLRIVGADPLATQAIEAWRG